MRLKGLKLLRNGISFLFVGFLLLSCKEERTLPIYGERDFNEIGDTVYHTIPDFSFINQDCSDLTQEFYKEKIYIADFFFTTCGGTCPIMSNSLYDVQEATKDLTDVLILSHTVDPETDSCAILKEYGIEKKADFRRWNFVTGSKRHLYTQATKYLVVASDAVDEELHFIHSDQLVLIDKKGRIRGMYSGVDADAVQQLIEDVKLLVKEK